MLKLSNIHKSYGGRAVLSGVSFVVNAGECAGVVGENGSGKTTLLRIAAGVEQADRGAVALTPGARIGYLPQGHAHDAARRAADVFPRAFPARHEAAVEHIAARMAAEADVRRRSQLEGEYEAAVAALASPAIDVRAAWGELRLRAIDGGERVGALSGGEQTKLGLIDLFAARPDVLLLDEPTNNLDLDALAWLGDILDGFGGPVLAVSHDRALLDEHASAVLELHAGNVEAFAGGYTEYAAEKARRREQLWERYLRQRRHERKVEQEIRAIKQTARRREAISQNDYYRRRNKKFMRRAVVLERRLGREIEADRIEKPRESYRVKLDLDGERRGGDRMLAAEGIGLSAGGRELLRDVELSVGWSERIVIIGPNGCGKTTLLRALSGEGTADSGAVRRGPSARIGHLPQDERLDAGTALSTPLDLVRSHAALSETEARRFLHRFLFSGDDALRPIGKLSYGERRRLSLADIILAGANVLLLDEPTNHLDIASREAFEAALDAFNGAMVAVTHDRYFIERFADRVLAVEDGRLVER